MLGHADLIQRIALIGRALNLYRVARLGLGDGDAADLNQKLAVVDRSIYLVQSRGRSICTGAGIAGIGAAALICGDDGRNGQIQQLACLNGAHVLLVVQRLEQLQISVIGNAVAAANAVGSVAGDDLMGHNFYTGAGGRRFGGGKQNRASDGNLIVAGNVIDLHDPVGVGVEVDPQRIADGIDRLAGLHHMGDKIAADKVAVKEALVVGAALSRGTAGDAGGGGGSAGSGQGEHRTGFQGVVVFDVIGLGDPRLVCIKVDPQGVADRKNRVAGLERILDCVVCGCRYGKAREQRRNHADGEQNAYQTLFHRYVPPNRPG